MMKSKKVVQGETIIIQAEETFLVYGCKGRKRVSIIAPFNRDDRLCRFTVSNPEVNKIEIETEGNFYLETRLPENRHDPVDPKPMELPEGAERPQSLKEQIAAALGEFMQRNRGWDEANQDEDDFELDMDEEIPLTRYEAMELTPEYLDIDSPHSSPEGERGASQASNGSDSPQENSPGEESGEVAAHQGDSPSRAATG